MDATSNTQDRKAGIERKKTATGMLVNWMPVFIDSSLLGRSHVASRDVLHISKIKYATFVTRLVSFRLLLRDVWPWNYSQQTCTKRQEEKVDKQAEFALQIIIVILRNADFVSVNSFRDSAGK